MKPQPGVAIARKTGNIVGNLTKFFLKSQMPRGLPGGGGEGGVGWAFLEFTDVNSFTDIVSDF